MSDGVAGFLVFLWISIGVAILVHAFDRKVFRASIVTAVLATVSFQTAVYLREGQLDKFFLLAVVVGGLYSWLMALMIGYVMSKMRPRAHLVSRR